MARRYLAIFAAILISGGLGSLHAFSVFLEPLERVFGATRGEISLLYSAATACLTLAMLAGPIAFRRVPPAALAGGVGVAAAIGMMVAGTGASLLIVGLGYSVLFGVANGVGYGFSLQIARQALPGRKGFGVGAVTAAYALGVVIFAQLFAVLVEIRGAQGAMRIMSAVFLVIGIVAAWLLQQSRIAAVAPRPLRALDQPSPDRRRFMLLWVGYCLGSAAGLMAMGHAAGIVDAKGGQAEQLVLGAMLIGLGNAAGGFVAGWLGDVWSARGLLLLSTLLSAAVLVVLIGVGDPLAAIGGLALVGLAYGAIIAVVPIAVAEYYRPDQVGSTFGRLFTAWGLAGLTAPWIAGVLFDVSGGYEAALLLATMAALLAASATFALPRPDLSFSRSG